MEDAPLPKVEDIRADIGRWIKAGTGDYAALERIELLPLLPIVSWPSSGVASSRLQLDAVISGLSTVLPESSTDWEVIAMRSLCRISMPRATSVDRWEAARRAAEEHGGPSHLSWKAFRQAHQKYLFDWMADRILLAITPLGPEVPDTWRSDLVLRDVASLRSALEATTAGTDLAIAIGRVLLDLARLFDDCPVYRVGGLVAVGGPPYSSVELEFAVVSSTGEPLVHGIRLHLWPTVMWDAARMQAALRADAVVGTDPSQFRAALSAPADADSEASGVFERVRDWLITCTPQAHESVSGCPVHRSIGELDRILAATAVDTDEQVRLHKEAVVNRRGSGLFPLLRRPSRTVLPRVRGSEVT